MGASYDPFATDDYKKLYKYKQLGEHHHKNKDLRTDIQGSLNEKEENKLSPTMWVTMNPQYRLEKMPNHSVFSEGFTGEQGEPVDKIYFRKRDEFS